MNAGTAEFEPPAPYDALDLSPLRGLPPSCWSRELHRADALTSQLVSARCAELVAERPAVIEARRFAWDWILRRLEQAPPAWPAATLDRAVAAMDRAGSTFELIERAARSYPAWLAGEIDGQAVLASREALALWERYFDNDNLLYAPLNRLAAATAARAAPDRPLRVLELGAGCGSGSEALIEALSGRIAAYHATDAAPALLAVARRRLARFAQPPSLGRLDLDLPLLAQPLDLPPRGFDLVFAVNTLHAARDLLFSLRELRSALAPDGALVLGEAVRPRRGDCVPIEFLFQLDRRFAAARLDPEFRPRGGFLCPEDWRVALARAGFSRIELLPDMQSALAAYPGWSMAALIAQR